MLIVTTTSGRPAAFEQLCRIVQAQTFDDYEWLVVTDDWEDYKFPKGGKVKVIKRDPANDKLPSICENWLVALDWIEKSKHERCVVLEDDDFYVDSYLRETNKLLDKADLVGWMEDAYYYVLSRKARRCHNTAHASLAATAFNRSVLPYLRTCCQHGDVFIDMMLWRGIRQIAYLPQAPLTLQAGGTLTPPPQTVSQVVSEWKGSRLLVDNFTGIPSNSKEQPKLDNAGNVANSYPRHVGMKQNWHGGKEGLSALGHDANAGGGPDIWGDQLVKWIGEEQAAFYLSKVKLGFAKPEPGKPYQGHLPGSVMFPLPMEKVA